MNNKYLEFDEGINLQQSLTRHPSNSLLSIIAYANQFIAGNAITISQYKRE